LLDCILIGPTNTKHIWYSQAERFDIWKEDDLNIYFTAPNSDCYSLKEGSLEAKNSIGSAVNLAIRNV
jgi:hypothetical protein